jgi:hypothetical protein
MILGIGDVYELRHYVTCSAGIIYISASSQRYFMRNKKRMLRIKCFISCSI